MRLFTLLALLILSSIFVSAQSTVSRHEDTAQMEVTLAYSADRTNQAPGSCGCFWMQGGKAEANMYYGRGVSVVAELTGLHASNISAAHQSLSLVTYLFGPRFTPWRSRRINPFAQFLFGGAHGFDSYFPNATGQTLNPDALAFAAGGGMNWTLSRHFAWRVFQADYLYTQLPNAGDDTQNHLRLAAGLVFRFPSGK